MGAEAVPHEVGKAVNHALSIFFFSIGAGSVGCCQVLNGYELIGAFDTFKPKFAKRYRNIAEVAVNGMRPFVKDLRSKTFPDKEHSYQMNPEEKGKLGQMLAGDMLKY